MQTSTRSVGPMDKVYLHIRAVPTGKTAANDAAEADVDLIYGIGSAGVTPFEKMLFEKSVGDTFTITVTTDSGNALFGHHLCTLTQAVHLSPPFQLDVTVSAIENAQSHEVVKAMAQATGCGGGCDCGCGC